MSSKRKATFTREVQEGKFVYTPVNKRAKSLGVSGVRKAEVRKANGGKFALYFWAKNKTLRPLKV